MTTTTDRVRRAVDALDARGRPDELGDRVRARVEAPDAVTLAVLGRRGAGKSSLLNALCDDARAVVGHVRDATDRTRAYRVPGLPRALWIDGPGLRSASGHSVEALLGAWRPAATLLLVTAVEAATSDPEFSATARFLRAREEGGDGLVVAVSKVDELDPVDVDTPPFRHPKKSLHIAQACAFVRRGLARVGVYPQEIVPVSALTVRREGVVVHDGRWNIEALRAALAALTARAPEDIGRRARWSDLGALLERLSARLKRESRALRGEERDAVLTLLDGRAPSPGVAARAVFGDDRAWVRDAARVAQRAGS